MLPLTLYLLPLFILGACVGSFLNVVIYRMPYEVSIDRPRRSFCPTCGHTLAWYDNIPVLAWFYLRGQCRYCGTAYGFRYPMVEALTGVLFVLVGYRFDLSVAAGVYLVFVAVLVAISFIDLDHYIIPTVLVWIAAVAAAIGLGVALFAPDVTTRLLCVSLTDALIGAVAGYALLWVARFLGSVFTGREAMGLGDLDLMALFGFVFGWQALLPILLLSSLTGSVIGLILKYRFSLGRYAEIPFGPYLVIAALTYLFAGHELLALLWGQEGVTFMLGLEPPDVRPWLFWVG